MNKISIIFFIIIKINKLCRKISYTGSLIRKKLKKLIQKLNKIFDKFK